MPQMCQKGAHSCRLLIQAVQGQTRKNAIVEYLDYQIPVTQLNRGMQVAKRD